MMETIDSKACSVDAHELARWFDRVNEPWNPIAAAARQLNALTGDTETPPALAAYDHLYQVASQAVGWLDLNSCPDEETGRRFKRRMTACRIVAATVRFSFSAGDEATVAQLVDLRELLDQQTAAMGL
jgi:hypothetical protein